LWHQFFDFFADGFHHRKITGESEGQFFRIMTELARGQYRLRFFLKDNCPGDDKMLQILSESVSLTTINEMSEAQFNKLQHSWHVVFIGLNKALGRLIQHREAVAPPTKAKAGLNEQVEVIGVGADDQGSK
jgi:hypothetical protein